MVLVMLLRHLLYDWFSDPDNKKLIHNLLEQVKIDKEEGVQNNDRFAKSRKFHLLGHCLLLDRDKAQEMVRKNGGLVSGPFQEDDLCCSRRRSWIKT